MAISGPISLMRFIICGEKARAPVAGWRAAGGGASLGGVPPRDPRPPPRPVTQGGPHLHDARVVAWDDLGRVEDEVGGLQLQHVAGVAGGQRQSGARLRLHVPREAGASMLCWRRTAGTQVRTTPPPALGRHLPCPTTCHTHTNHTRSHSPGTPW